MPRVLLRDLENVGRGIAIARRRRRIPVELMLQRTGLSKRTYQQVEKGVPTVAMAAYAMALNALGLAGNLALLADPTKDEAGQLLEAESLPKRIRQRRSP